MFCLGTDQLISWRGEGGGVEEFVKKKFAEPQKGIKKFAHATLWKKICKAKHQTLWSYNLCCWNTFEKKNYYKRKICTAHAQKKKFADLL